MTPKIKFYVTVIETAAVFSDMDTVAQDKIVSALELYRDAVGATWKPQKEKLVTIGCRTITPEVRDAVITANDELCEYATTDCEITSYRGGASLCCPEEVWERTLHLEPYSSKG